MDIDVKEDKLQATAARINPCKIFGISSFFGVSFGIVATIIIYIKGDLHNIYMGLVLLLFCGFLAGIAGITGNFLKNWLQARGMKSRLQRSIMSFIIVLFMTLLITYIFYFQVDFNALFYQVEGKMVWGILIGCVFGVVVTIAEYYNWKVERKLLILEMKNRHLEELTEKDSILKETSKNLLIARERNKMARELHDSISQGIHGITFSIDSLLQELDRVDFKEEKVMKIVNYLKQTADNTQQELRHVINELQPALLEKNSLREALSIYCDLFTQRQRIKLDKDIDEVECLSPEQEFAVFRVLQEALTNIQKHANAGKIEVSFKKCEDKVLLKVIDDGEGFASEHVKKGNGLNNMEFRSRQAGGDFAVISYPGRGTEIRVSI